MDDRNSAETEAAGTVARVLSEPAKRALAEAEARRAAAADDATVNRPRELQGRRGPEPTRYGDWENKGIISDF